MTSDDQKLGPLADSLLGRLNPAGGQLEALTPESWQDEFKLYLETPQGRPTLENIEHSRNGMTELFQEASPQPEKFTSQVGFATGGTWAVCARTTVLRFPESLARHIA